MDTSYASHPRASRREFTREDDALPATGFLVNEAFVKQPWLA